MSGLDDVRAAQDRDFGAEGIPAYVVLVDEVDDEQRPGTGQGHSKTRDEDLADGLRSLREEIAPRQRDDDLGVTATLLAAAAFAEHRDQASR